MLRFVEENFTNMMKKLSVPLQCNSYDVIIKIHRLIESLD